MSLSRERLTQLVREYVLAADTGKSGSCHLFRHTCATLMLEGGADIRYIQEMLGHVELSTTQIYTQMSIRRLKAVHSLTHPSAKLEKAASSTSSVNIPSLVADGAAPLLNAKPLDDIPAVADGNVPANSAAIKAEASAAALYASDDHRS